MFICKSYSPQMFYRYYTWLRRMWHRKYQFSPKPSLFDWIKTIIIMSFRYLRFSLGINTRMSIDVKYLWTYFDLLIDKFENCIVEIFLSKLSKFGFSDDICVSFVHAFCADWKNPSERWKTDDLWGVYTHNLMIIYHAYTLYACSTIIISIRI